MDAVKNAQEVNRRAYMKQCAAMDPNDTELQKLRYMVGEWQVEAIEYNMRTGQVDQVLHYAMSNSWEPALENQWLFARKSDHIEMFGYKKDSRQVIMWSMSSHRINKIKQWKGAFDGDKLIVFLQQDDRGTFAARIRHDQSGGLRIVEAMPGSPAESAGLKVDEVITSVNGIAFTPVNQMSLMASQTGRAGEKITIAVRGTDGSEREVTMTLVKKPICRLTIQPARENQPVTWRYDIDDRCNGNFALKEIMYLR